MKRVFLTIGACGVVIVPLISTISCNQNEKVEMKDDGIFHKNTTAIRINYEIGGQQKRATYPLYESIALGSFEPINEVYSTKSSMYFLFVNLFKKVGNFKAACEEMIKVGLTAKYGDGLSFDSLKINDISQLTDTNILAQ